MNRMMFEPEREDALYLPAYDSNKQVLYIFKINISELLFQSL